MDLVPSVPKMLAHQVVEPMTRGSEAVAGTATEVISKGTEGVGDIKNTITDTAEGGIGDIKNKITSTAEDGIGDIKNTVTSTADDISISKCAISCACCTGCAMCVLCVPCMVLGMVVNCLLLPVNAAIDCFCPSQPPLTFPVIDKTMFD